MSDLSVSADFVGTKTRPYQCKVDWQHCMAYAAATADNNERYLDDEREGGIVAPPLLAIALTWPIIQHLPNYIEDADFPFHVLKQQVHFTEHLHFFQPIKPDMELVISGQIVAIQQKKAGVYLLVRFEATNKSNQIVFIEHIGGLLRGVSCDQDRQIDNMMPTMKREESENLSSRNANWQKKIYIEPFLPHIYDACGRIHFPIHTSKKFARKVGLPDIILHGSATLALAVKSLINQSNEFFNDVLKHYEVIMIDCQFSGMVLPDTDIKIKLNQIHQTENLVKLDFEVLDQNDNLVIKNGSIGLSLNF
ncbi:MAG: MaoC/PaaZ C-terminal domain-containing protein [Gammaproteobacteria bacterium]|nr:MaoC/PaaZ C-terminal domain-containing protein [Gammaproteobacteria bacterium]